MRRALAVALVVAAIVSSSAGALDGNDRKLYRATNDYRVAHDVHRLERRPRLHRIAARAVRRMILCRCLTHSVKPPCGYWGQNVGVGLTVRRVFRGFVRSNEHRRNLLDPVFHKQGNVARRAFGLVWVAQEFCR